MKTRGTRFLVLAVVVFVAAALLMWFGQGEEAISASVQPPVEFPRKLRPQEKTRAQARRTWVVPTPDAGPPQGASDPLLAALPRGKGRTAVVLEANALRHSPIGELLLECLYRDGGKQLRQLQERTGIDPLTDLDRLAITDDGLVLSGNFGKAKTDELLGKHGRSSYGDSARIYEPPTERVLADGGVGRGGPTIAMWGNQMIVVGRDRDGVRDVIDRVEGRGSQEPPVLHETGTYGEVYGVIATPTIAKVLPPDQREIAEQLVRAAGAVELHVDARGDVAVVADVKGEDAQAVTDLGKSLGGALALARMRARSEGEEDVAKLLDFARVRPDENAFRLEVALPIDVLKERLAFCREPVPEAAAGDGGVEL